MTDNVVNHDVTRCITHIIEVIASQADVIKLTTNVLIMIDRSN